MDNLDRREILSRVAAGTISPEEAASQLDSLHGAEAAAQPAIRKVRVARQLGSIEIVGDPTVRDAVAEGPHRARIDGDTMVFEGEVWETTGSFVFGFPQAAANDRLLIRLNPSLALDLDVQAGSCRIRGVEGPIRADIQAGSATIEGFRGELNLTVQAGSVKASGRLDGGESRISCDAGSVNLNLERGSSVRIKAHATLGKVDLPGQVRINGRGVAEDIAVGDGAGSLAIETNMGSVKVTAA